MQVVFVAASKVDLPGRKVTEKEGRDWAAVHNFPYFEVRLKVQAGKCPCSTGIPEHSWAFLPCSLQSSSSRSAAAVGPQLHCLHNAEPKNVE